MIQGIVTESLEATVRLRLIGMKEMEAELDAVIDTGFTQYLTLPQNWVDALALPLIERDRMYLADGSDIVVNLHEGMVAWEGREREVVIHCVEGPPLIGMSLLLNHLLTAEVKEGGIVTLSPLS